MAYTTYTTEALVCGTWNRNTADKSYLLFTKAAGMLYAEARSVREEKSKQRYALQDFSYVRVSLVRGKQQWRIGSVEALANHYHQAADKAARGSVVKLYRTLRRFYSGEEPAPELFELLVRGLEVIRQSVEHRADVELVLELQLLHALGYVDTKRVPKAVLASVTHNTTLSPADRTVISSILEQGIASSQL